MKFPYNNGAGLVQKPSPCCSFGKKRKKKRLLSCLWSRAFSSASWMLVSRSSLRVTRVLSSITDTWCACVLSRFSHVQLFATLWTVACQAPCPMGFSRQEKLEWVAMPSSRGSSLMQGSNLRLLQLLHCRQLLYCWATGKSYCHNDPL